MCVQCYLLKAQMRENIIKLHLEKGVSLKDLSETHEYHRNTLSNWKTAYLQDGLAGLIDKPRAPHNNPNKFDCYTIKITKKIRTDKNNRRVPGPITIQKRLNDEYGIKASRSGIAKLLKREGLVDPKKSRRLAKKNRVKACKIYDPGELVQIDVKYAFKGISDYWYYQYSSLDYVSGIVHGTIYEIQSNLESVLFLRGLPGFLPFQLRGVQTDNHSTFTNRYTGYIKSADPISPRLHAFDLECQRLGIEHYLIDKGKPAQNGKVERFHRTCEEEFYQRESFINLEQARRKFRDFLYYYNHERYHQGLDNMTPIEKLRSFPEYEHIKEII